MFNQGKRVSLDSPRARGQVSGPPVIGLVAGTLFLFAIGAAEAQQRSNLTRAQEGRAEVAKCYARCLAAAEPMTQVRIALDALDGEWSTAVLRYVVCENDQVIAQRQDACSSGCRDIEVSYGVRSSYIRTRYYWHLNRALRDLRTSGLWNAWNRFPDPGTDAFIRACARYAQITTSSRATAARKLEEVEPVDLSELTARRQRVIESEYRPEPPPFDDIDLWED
ncbi:MAG: hypothetical protein OXU81_10000 [Gammaproteobacteria bacterium]|nr:hypothetical protein [Gammaproteobacteria bacterium]